MHRVNTDSIFIFLSRVLAVGLLLFSGGIYAQSNDGGVKFLFECDSMQTTILADRHISITVTEENGTVHLAEDDYCSSKLISLPPGYYTISISSDKFCDEEIHNVAVCKEKVTFILLDLYRSADRKCKSKKQFSSPISTSCG